MSMEKKYKKATPLLLVLDDEINDRLLLKKALKSVKLDCQAVFFRSAKELLTFLRQATESQRKQNAIDSECVESLILLDLLMPGSSGFDVLSGLKSDCELKGIPVVVMTGSATTKNASQSFQLGASDIIQKPTSFRELVEVVESVCEYWLFASKTPRVLMNTLKPADLLYTRPENSSSNYDDDQRLLLEIY